MRKLSVVVEREARNHLARAERLLRTELDSMDPAGLTTDNPHAITWG